MRMAVRGPDGKAKAVRGDEEGNTEVKLNNTKKLIRRQFGIKIEENSQFVPMRNILNTSYIEVAFFANELDREVLIQPVFGVSEGNFKTSLTSIGEYNYYLRGTPNKRETSFVIKTTGDFLDGMYFTSTDGNPIEIDVHIWELYTPPIKRIGSYGFFELTANPTIASYDFDFSGVQFVTNDGNDDVFVGLNESLQNRMIRLKPGETLNDIQISVQKIFVRSRSGNQPIRIMGVK